jgi:hypothetical protein
MKLPADAIIAAEKVTRYLLVRQTRGDKSAFLARGGYTLENAAQLLNDLRIHCFRSRLRRFIRQNLGSFTKFVALSADQMVSPCKFAPFG